MSAGSSTPVEELLTQLQDGDRGVVRRAVDALVAKGPGEPGMVERLESRLNDVATRWRWPVAFTLGHLAEASEDCLKVLAEGLGSDDQDVRWATQRLLTAMGGTQGKARELLLGLLRRGAATQRRMAVYCLRDVGLGDDQIAGAVVEACQDSEPLVRVAAVTSLTRCQSLPEQSVSILRRLAEADSDVRVRNAANFVLTRALAE